MKTKIISFLGGPGCGKSTAAARTFAQLKDERVLAEHVTEYIKSWAWEGRTPSMWDQLYITAKQIRAESLLLGKVDVIVTDSPVWIGYFYTSLVQSPLGPAVFAMCEAYHRIAALDGHEHMFVWLDRVKAYEPRGRYQTEGEAREIDTAMRQALRPLTSGREVSVTQALRAAAQ